MLLPGDLASPQHQSWCCLPTSPHPKDLRLQIPLWRSQEGTVGLHPLPKAATYQLCLLLHHLHGHQVLHPLGHSDIILPGQQQGGLGGEAEEIVKGTSPASCFPSPGRDGSHTQGCSQCLPGLESGCPHDPPAHPSPTSTGLQGTRRGWSGSSHVFSPRIAHPWCPPSTPASHQQLWCATGALGKAVSPGSPMAGEQLAPLAQPLQLHENKAGGTWR